MKTELDDKALEGLGGLTSWSWLFGTRALKSKRLLQEALLVSGKMLSELQSWIAFTAPAHPKVSSPESVAAMMLSGIERGTREPRQVINSQLPMITIGKASRSRCRF